MTAGENRDLNRRCAEALGWKIEQSVTGWRWFRDQVPVSDTWPTKGSAERHVTDFLTPNGAALLIAESERRGWHLTRYDYRSIRPLPAYPSQHRANIRERGDFESDGWWGASDESAEIALALAFLAADEASKAQEGGEE